MKTSKVLLALCCLALCAGISNAQTTGDGIPDIWHVTPGGETFMTSAGMITRTVGDLVLDTDGYAGGVVALLIEGPNLLDTCTVPDGFCGPNLNLPDPNNPPFNLSNWTAGYIAGKTQWIRTNPLNTAGFQGVIGEYADPFGLSPDKNLSRFTGPTSALGLVTVASNNGSSLNNLSVTPTVPEPASLGLMALALVSMMGLRRR